MMLFVSEKEGHLAFQQASVLKSSLIKASHGLAITAVTLGK